jgi:alpha-soluble NSF attachment protein
MQCDAGRFSNAAKLQKQVAEIYEQENHSQEALEAYSQAADYFVGENQTSSAQPMFLKVAQISAQLERYPAAIEIYEKVARTSMENNLLKYNAKSHLLNAGICAMATKDIVLVKQKLEEFNDIDYTFVDSREGKFLAAIATAVETFNTDGFSDAVYEFDTITKLEPWKVTLLLKVKESIAGEIHDDLT